MPDTTPLTWKAWIKSGLISAGHGGLISVVDLVVGAVTTEHFGWAQIQHAAFIFAIGSAVSLRLYLKQSPVPGPDTPWDGFGRRREDE